MAIGCVTKDLEQKKFSESTVVPNKVVVNVEDMAAKEVLDLILVQLGGSSGDPIHLPFQGVTTPGVEQNPISVTVPAGKTRSIQKVRVTCRQRLVYRVEIDGSIIGSGRVGSGQYTDDLLFLPAIEAAENLDIDVFIKQDTGKASDVEVYLMASDA